jgi:hypothetical protein
MRTDRPKAARHHQTADADRHVADWQRIPAVCDAGKESFGD